jgi:hypothetical protein
VTAAEPSPSLEGLLGAGAAEAVRRLGRPAADRRAGGQRWMVFELGGVGSLRCRFSPRLSSWSLTFDHPLPDSLRAAARAVGLWPDLGPDAELPGDSRRMVRRQVEDRGGAPASATALLGPDGVLRLAIFDEEPEW